MLAIFQSAYGNGDVRRSSRVLPVYNCVQSGERAHSLGKPMAAQEWNEARDNKRQFGQTNQLKLLLESRAGRRRCKLLHVGSILPERRQHLAV